MDCQTLEMVKEEVEMVNKSNLIKFFFGVLTLIFITLKLIGVIDWNWIIVLSPIVIPIAYLFLKSLVKSFLLFIVLLIIFLAVRFRW